MWSGPARELQPSRWAAFHFPTHPIWLTSDGVSTRLVDTMQARFYALCMITKEQCRAARGFLNWSQTQLAERAGVDRSTIKDFEGGRHTPNRTNMAAIIGAFDSAGVEFTNGKQPGVRSRLP